jgi:hypothetical protein
MRGIAGSRGTTHALCPPMDEHRMMTTPTFFEIMTHWHPGLASGDGGLTPIPAREERRWSRQRLWAVRELLGALDETAVASRDQLMQMLEVLRSDVLRPTLRLGKRQLETVMTTLAELDHETTRARPDVALFCQRARLVVDVLLLG